MSRRQKRGRDVNGILLLDKSTGMTSNAALQEVKRLYGARKAGHTGSLDPLASGLLPVCFGEATKFSRFLLEADKYYRVTGKLGVRTASGDAEGEVVETRPVPELTEAGLREVLERFTGSIEQVPSMYSAIKHQGQPLYKLAHKGLEVERQPRSVIIHELELLRFEGDELELEIRCTKGTYVRTLVEDIGEALGCGAHVIVLRRLGAGPYEGQPMYTLGQLREMALDGGTEALDGLLLPLESSTSHWPEVRLSEAAAFYLRQGQPVIVPRAPTQGWVRLYGADSGFLGVGEILDDGRVAPRRLIQEG
ncbi:MAG: tRNA pseudouridine(55) synthase TruB [Gammaproteobacteria bacterium]|nr:tRNA pseudouridine(55) synthase TruB [Gammaproteobacteria bacterium]